MILNHNPVPNHAIRLAQKNHRIFRVMKHVDKEDDVHTSSFSRNRSPVELTHRNFRLGSDQNIKTSDGCVWSQPVNLPGKASVAAADIQDRRPGRQHFGDVPTQDFHPSTVNVSAMDPL
jgi:hypothetical protein